MWRVCARSTWLGGVRGGGTKRVSRDGDGETSTQTQHDKQRTNTRAQWQNRRRRDPPQVAQPVSVQRRRSARPIFNNPSSCGGWRGRCDRSTVISSKTSLFFFFASPRGVLSPICFRTREQRQHRPSSDDIGSLTSLIIVRIIIIAERCGPFTPYPRYFFFFFWWNSFKLFVFHIYHALVTHVRRP